MRFMRKSTITIDRLDRFLDPRGDEAAVIRETDRQSIEHPAADRVSGERAHAPEQQKQQDLPQAHQLERVEPGEHREQDEHGNEREAPMGGLGQ